MSKKKLRVVVLTRGGAERLLELLSAVKEVEIAGVFLETLTEQKQALTRKLKRSIRYDGYLATIRKLSTKVVGGRTAGADELKAAQEAQDNLEQLSSELKIPIHRVADFHAEESINLLKAADGDLGIVFGTNILRESVFGIPRLGSINVHQGRAPLYRGGPTVFWELFNDEKEIGITIHFVASKVDTGDIILQKILPLEYDFSRFGLDYEKFLSEYRALLHEPSAAMVVAATELIASGRAQRIKQDTNIGKRYRLPTKKEKDALYRLLKQRRHEKMSEVGKVRQAELAGVLTDANDTKKKTSQNSL